MFSTDSLIKSSKLETYDAYSYSEPDRIRVKHLDLELEILFDQRILKGTATLILHERFVGDLVLDTRDLTIEDAEYSAHGREFFRTAFELGAGDPVRGAPLIIHLPSEASAVRLRYITSENASGLQWLDALQTAGKRHPFLFTQSEATHARSWVPIQDSPRVRMTLSARVRMPADVKAVMSAVNNAEAWRKSDPQFTMPYPIPAYLLALAAGDLDFRELSTRTGVFSEKTIVEEAAREFENLEEMLCAAEALFGPYRWGRYDVLVLPPSFPVGGMENPCLTFTSPTIIAGDKSLTSVIVHELAHSWSSNVANGATWRHFWMNEAFTVYMERRILEQLYGSRRAEIEAVLGLQELKRELSRLDAKDQVLEGQVNGRDPNSNATQVPYEKGALFLRTIEETVGRRRFDEFLREYFNHFAFGTVTTSQFVEYLRKNLLYAYQDAEPKLSIEEWIHGAGIPKGAAYPTSDVLEKVERRAQDWLEGRISLRDVQRSAWTTHEWLRFLECISGRIDTAKMQELDREFDLTNSGNAEIEYQWLLMAVRNRYTPAYQRLEQFLTAVGRRKFLKPLYLELAKTPEGKKWAQAIYDRASPNYHPISRDAVKSVLN